MLNQITLSAALILLTAAGAFAQGQGMNEDEYRRLMDQYMKSGNNYSQAQSQSWDARLKVVAGTVMVKTADAGEWSRVTGEMPLDHGDQLKTGADGQAELLFDDKGVVALTRNTELELSSLDQEESVLSLSVGALVAKFRHFLNSKQNLQVRTPSAVCAVRGTEFAVEHSQLGKETAVGVFDEGRLAVSLSGEEGGQPGQEYVLEKNTEMVLSPGQKRLRALPLSRLNRHRGGLLKARKRLESLKGWKPLSAARREEMRERALKRNIVRRELDRAKSKKAAPGAVKRRPAKKRSSRGQGR